MGFLLRKSLKDTRSESRLDTSMSKQRTQKTLKFEI